MIKRKKGLEVMLKYAKRAGAIVVLIACLTGCVTVSASDEKGSLLETRAEIYVEKAPSQEDVISNVLERVSGGILIISQIVANVKL